MYHHQPRAYAEARRMCFTQVNLDNRNSDVSTKHDKRNQYVEFPSSNSIRSKKPVCSSMENLYQNDDNNNNTTTIAINNNNNNNNNNCFSFLKYRSQSLFNVRDDPISSEERKRSLKHLLEVIHEELPSSERDVTDTLTDTSNQSDSSFESNKKKFSSETLNSLDISHLRHHRQKLQFEVEHRNQQLMKAVRQRCHQKSKLSGKCAILTAILHAFSAKRGSKWVALTEKLFQPIKPEINTRHLLFIRDFVFLRQQITNQTSYAMFGLVSLTFIQHKVKNLLRIGIDSRLKFAIEPGKGENGMQEWLEAMKAVSRLPGGIPEYFRKKLWKTLAEDYMKTNGLDWESIKTSSLSDRIQENDELIHSQILKDLHRTGWDDFNNEKKLKQLLLAYARYNKEVGYCQGFNIIGALILQVVDFDVPDALQIFIFLVEKVIPNGYFDQTLRALSVDMSALKDLLHQRLPKTMIHLEHLQKTAGNDYEPPLTNVFSIHWLLTLFVTCLHRRLVYRIWDAVMLDGSEILLRTALAIWAKISRKVLQTKSADEFYELMEVLTRQLVQMTDAEQDSLITVIYTMSPFPYPELAELRDKYTWNIQPLSTTFKLFQRTVDNILHETTDSYDKDADNVAKASDVFQLEQQYKKLLNRQRQAAVILKTAFIHGQNSVSGKRSIVINSSPMGNSTKLMFNHLQLSTAMNSSPSSQSNEDNLHLLGNAFSASPTTIQPPSSTVQNNPQSTFNNCPTVHKSQIEIRQQQQKAMLRKSKAILNSLTTTSSTFQWDINPKL